MKDLPENAQTAVRALLDGWGDNDQSSSGRHLRNLIADENLVLAGTWRNIDHGIGDGPFAVNRWMMLFDLLATLPGAVDQSFPNAFDEADTALPNIAKQAKELAKTIKGYWRRCEKHAISHPPELDTLDHLIGAAYDRRGKSAETCWLWYQERCGYSEPQILPDGQEVGKFSRDHRPSSTLDIGRFGSEIARLLDTLADACEEHEHAATGPHSLMLEATHQGNRTPFRPYVVNFDYRLEHFYRRPDLGPEYLPRNFEVKAEDLAKLLSALLPEAVSRQTVENARKRREDTPAGA
ncbi:MAG TPA: hypothetical protein VKA64_11115 [Gammaproteobacteria bacterium]|nr:hypothetical protein [Gammaproteobacteria bacterium]